ncbi:UDP-glucose 4-epimerase GalE [Sporomusa termitida]|uniref:UDP-glucose 4-epimerase n=1 Tax=Sporomusa termitida TaxID=2377 RepID=A0A517DXA3_9FIRM|nr:UDP-glucose 4-epimerase GalE [Sporomusa termitida]QDR81989.1 UDP-glucose 4-epimerase [Sporomusa termitida]
MSILVTGGTGYIGSHTCVELLQAGYDVIIVDNLSNSKAAVLNRIKAITGQQPGFYQLDIRDRDKLDKVFAENRIEAVIHFAGLKAVGESVALPLAYYHNNITGTLVLCELMAQYGVKQLVFSSSATVYGVPERIPLGEDCGRSATNPYGRTKLMIEDILSDLYAADPAWGIALLRYFNPIGAHESGNIGEDPHDIPNNLMPYITQVAIGKRDKLSIFGNDYDTPDGTGVRDFIHVVDLAKGHLKALEKVLVSPGVTAYNLGTGQGYSVLELVRAFEQATGRPIPYVITGRRPGDIGICYADTTRAKAELGWVAEKNIEDMCKDAWNWQINNPQGYRDGM